VKYCFPISRILLKGLIVFGAIALALPLCAQVRMTVQVDEQRVTTKDYVHIQYTIEHARKLTRFLPPPFQGFSVVQGPDYTNGWTLVNGEMKEYVAISFILQPKRKGRWIIPAATATADGKTLRSGSIAIEVTDQSSGVRPGGDISPGNQQLNEMILRKGETVQDKVRKNLFVKLDVSRRSVFVGEPVVATYKLFTRLNSESRVVRRPSFAGFSVFDMEEPESDMPHTEMLNGQEYNVYLLRMVQLYPLQAGTYELESMQVDNTVRFVKESAARDENTLNGILRALGQQSLDPDAWVREMVTLENPPVTITVRPLPDQGQPENFSGAVGQFRLSATPSSGTLVQGNAYRLDVLLEGSGNLPVIGPPSLGWSAAWENFEPEIMESARKEISPISGKKIYSIPFTPRLTGTQYLPAVSMSYFDPKTGKYVMLKTDSLAVDVKEGRSRETGTGEPAGKSGDGPGMKADAIREMLLRYGWIPGLAALILLPLYFWTRKKKRVKPMHTPRELDSYLDEEPAPVTQLSLFPATYNLELAKSFLLLRDPAKFYQEIARVFRAVLAERYSVDALQSGELLMAGMRRSNLDESVVPDIAGLLEHCQMAIYAPLADPESMEEDYSRAARLLEILQAPAPGNSGTFLS
jgi:hypothetical protein